MLHLVAAVAEDTASLLQSSKVNQRDGSVMDLSDISFSDIESFTVDMEAAVKALKSEEKDTMLLNLYRRASQNVHSDFVEKYSASTTKYKMQLIDAVLKSPKVMGLIESIPDADRRALLLQFSNANQELVQDQVLAGKKGKGSDATVCGKDGKPKNNEQTCYTKKDKKKEDKLTMKCDKKKAENHEACKKGLQKYITDLACWTVDGTKDKDYCKKKDGVSAFCTVHRWNKDDNWPNNTVVEESMEGFGGGCKTKADLACACAE